MARDVMSVRLSEEVRERLHKEAEEIATGRRQLLG